MHTKAEKLEFAKQEIEKIIKELNAETACFTGHRAHKLPWKDNEEDIRCKNMQVNLHIEIERAILAGYKIFLCGMALGFDLICAKTVLKLKEKYQDIKLVGVLPCKTQPQKWKEKDKKLYESLLKQADSVRCLYEKYIGAKCMHERNRYMVSNSSLVIALFNGLPGGTKSTIEYAKKQGLDVVLINCT